MVPMLTLDASEPLKSVPRARWISLLQLVLAVGEVFLEILGGLVFEVLAKVAVGAGDVDVLGVLRDAGRG